MASLRQIAVSHAPKQLGLLKLSSLVHALAKASWAASSERWPSPRTARATVTIAGQYCRNSVRKLSASPPIAANTSFSSWLRDNQFPFPTSMDYAMALQYRRMYARN